jgi:hypothetical protein
MGFIDTTSAWRRNSSAATPVKGRPEVLADAVQSAANKTMAASTIRRIDRIYELDSKNVARTINLVPERPLGYARAGLKHACLFFVLALAAGKARAQETGAIGGVVADATGAVLPDTSVRVEHEEGIASRTQSTGARGGYGFSGLPVGGYRVSFEKNGFQPAVGRRVVVTAGASVQLDVTLELERLADEVVEVAAARSTDRKRTRPSDVLERSFLEEVPTGRSIWAALELTGSVVSDRFDVGGSESGQQSRIAATGTSYTQDQYFINGVNVTDSAALGASATYYSFDSFEEVSASLSSHPAELQSPGVYVNVVVKSGTSKLHGGGAVYYENDSLQSDNLDDSLRAQGVSQSTKLGSYFDGALELSGPFLGERALWYASYARQRIDPFVIGFFLPDGEPGSDPTTLTTFLARGTLRLGTDENVNLFFLRNDKLRENRDASRFRPTPETALYQDSTTTVLQGAYSRVFRQSVLLDARLALVDLDFPLGERPELPPDSFSRIELASGIRSDGPGTNEVFERDRLQANLSLSLFRDDWLSGSHDLKLGFERNVTPTSTTYDLNGAILYRDFFGAPLQVEIYGDPLTREDRTASTSFFAQDSYVRGKLVLNLGARFDYWTAGYPDQSREPGPWEEFFREWGLSESVPGDSRVASFASLAPRVGVTYSLTEDGGTILRGGYGRYYHQIGSSLSVFANPNGRASALFSFTDADSNRILDPGEVDFDRPLAVNLPAANDVDPDLMQPRSDEVTLGIEHELSSGLAVSGTAVYRRDRLLIDDVNVGVPFTDFEEALALDPGRDLAVGTDDDSLLPVFNQSRESLGRDRFLLENPEGLESRYRGIELVARRRFDGRWQMRASLTLGESDGFLPGPGLESNEGASFPSPLYDNPNTLVNAKGRTFWDRPRILRVSGSYHWRFGIGFAAAYRYQIGQPLYRSIQVGQTIEGVPLNQGPVEILAEPQGAVVQPALHVLDLRAEKDFGLGRYGRLGVLFDLFNAFNANTATEVSSRRGAFGAILDILPPRVARVGVRYRF